MANALLLLRAVTQGTPIISTCFQGDENFILKASHLELMDAIQSCSLVKLR